MPPKEDSVTQFLNVDLDIRAPAGLEALLGSMASSIVVLHQAEHVASVELNEEALPLEVTVVKFIELIESFSPAMRDIWNRCEWRSLNIGIQAGSEPHSSTFALSERALSLIAAVKLEVVFTVYAPHT
jgi:hypothetical protein